MTTTNFTAGTVVASDWLNDVDAATYEGAGVYTPAGTGAVATTVQEKNRRVIDIFDKLTAAQKTDVTTSAFTLDLSTAFANAMTDFGTAPGTLVLQPGGYLLGSMVTVPDTVNIVGPKSAVVKKGFNGDVFTLGAKSTLEGFYIDGNGATYTGRGVIITTGAVDPFPMTTAVYWRRIFDMDIINTASYCVEYTAALAGYGSQIRGGRLIPYNNYLIPAVKYPAAAEANGNRSMIGVWTGSNIICELGGSNNSQIIGCNGGHPTFTADTKKAIVTGNRFPDPGATLTFDGTQNVVCENVIAAAAIVYAATAIGGRYENFTIGTITDNSASGTSNNTSIDIPQQNYTPTWSGTGGPPAIGNGTLNGAWSRKGTTAPINIQFQAGSTTNFNTTTGFTFTLPYTSVRTTTGSCYMLDSGTSHYIGIARVAAGSNLVSVYRDGAGLGVGYLTPMTWANGDQLVIDIEISV